ncbi:MAG: BrnA antitoxin family protein [Chloroflexota bacterium]|nr:BrnA antitoxin family protein [Chloroflexota bacterium]
MKKTLEVPEFKNEDDEREFWAQINLADYYEPEDAKPVVFPNLKPETRPISIRFPVYVLDALKERANLMGVPYHALIKQAVVEYLGKEA